MPLTKYEVVFFAKGKRGSETSMGNNDTQGLTLDEIDVDMKGGRFSPGQAYVAFSCVKTLKGLHILNFNAKAIKKTKWLG